MCESVIVCDCGETDGSPVSGRLFGGSRQAVADSQVQYLSFSFIIRHWVACHCGGGVRYLRSPRLVTAAVRNLCGWLAGYVCMHARVASPCRRMG